MMCQLRLKSMQMMWFLYHRCPQVYTIKERQSKIHVQCPRFPHSTIRIIIQTSITQTRATKSDIYMLVLVLWCLVPLSTIYQLAREGLN